MSSHYNTTSTGGNAQYSYTSSSSPATPAPVKPVVHNQTVVAYDTGSTSSTGNINLPILGVMYLCRKTYHTMIRIALLIFFSTVYYALAAQNAKPHDEVAAKAKKAAQSVIPVHVEGAEDAAISIEFVTPAASYKMAADGSISEKLDIVFGSNAITCDFKLNADETCTFTVGGYSLHLKGKGGAELNGSVWNYGGWADGLASWWESTKKSWGAWYDSVTYVRPRPQSLEELRARYANTPPNRKLAESEGGWSLDDGKAEIERQIRDRIDRNQLPGFLNHLLNDPAEECAYCEQWRRSGHFIDDEMLKCLDDIEFGQKYSLPYRMSAAKLKLKRLLENLPDKTTDEDGY